MQTQISASTDLIVFVSFYCFITVSFLSSNLNQSEVNAKKQSKFYLGWAGLLDGIYLRCFSIQNLPSWDCGEVSMLSSEANCLFIFFWVFFLHRLSVIALILSK